MSESFLNPVAVSVAVAVAVAHSIPRSHGPPGQASALASP